MKYIFPYIALVFFALSCKKSDHPCQGKYTHTYSTISTYFNPYKFKEGTYWVYQNDATTQIDSQRVVSAIDTQIGSGGSSSCGSTYAQLYSIGVRSYLTNDYFKYLILGSSFIRNLDDSNTPNGTSILNSINIQQPAAIPSMTINGNTFSNIRKIFVDQFNLEDNDFYFYFVDYVGLVKWEKVAGSTVLESWSIQSWEVIL